MGWVSHQVDTTPVQSAQVCYLQQQCFAAVQTWHTAAAIAQTKQAVSVSSWDPLQLPVGFCLLYLPPPDPQARTAAQTNLLVRAQHLFPADLQWPGSVSSVQAQKGCCRLQVAVREQSASPLQDISTCFFVCIHAAVTMQKSLSTNLALGEQASLQEISSQQVAFAGLYLLLHLWTGCIWYARQGFAHNVISCRGKGSKLVQDTPACASHCVQPALFRHLT